MNAYYLSLKEETPKSGYWDYGFLDDFINGKLWQPPNYPEIEKVETDTLPKDDKAIVIIPARHHADMIKEVNKNLKNIDKVVLFLMGDEEADFPVEEISHKNIDIWVQNPHPKRHDNYNKLGTGYPPQSQEILPKLEMKKKLNLFFSGQITHDRRFELIDVLNEYDSKVGKSVVNRTKGFTQGMDHFNYYKNMVMAKVSPAPSGAVIPDSFRLFEALECMSIPIADEKCANGTIMEYWDWLFDEATPFPHVTEWDRLYGLMIEILDGFPHNMHQQTAWWIAKKRDFAYKVCEQLSG